MWLPSKLPVFQAVNTWCLIFRTLTLLPHPDVEFLCKDNLKKVIYNENIMVYKYTLPI